jgi:hypothetical protein
LGDGLAFEQQAGDAGLSHHRQKAASFCLQHEGIHGSLESRCLEGSPNLFRLVNQASVLSFTRGSQPKICQRSHAMQMSQINQPDRRKRFTQMPVRVGAR